MSNPNRRLDAIEVAVTEERTTLENDLAAADAVLTRKLEDLASAEEKLSAAKDGKPITKEDFVDYSKKVVQPIFEDIKILFLDINGDFRALSATYSSARVLDPIFAMGRILTCWLTKSKHYSPLALMNFAMHLAL